MRILVKCNNNESDEEDPVWMVLDFTPQLLQEIQDTQELLKPKNTRAVMSPDPLLLCGKLARVVVFWAEIIGVVLRFHPQFAHYGEPDATDYIADWTEIPEYLNVEDLGRSVKFDEARIWVEHEDIMWSVTVLDTRHSCYYTQLSQFANQLSRGRKQ